MRSGRLHFVSRGLLGLDFVHHELSVSIWPEPSIIMKVFVFGQTRPNTVHLLISLAAEGRGYSEGLLQPTTLQY